LLESAWVYHYFGRRGTARKHFSYSRFLEGYGPHPEPEDSVALYRPVIWLDKLSWIRPDSERADGYRQRLAGVCEG
jgi:hypothetical protein